jgi:hypothetical protein
MSEAEGIRRQASLGKALGRGLRAAYDALGFVVAASFGTFVVGAVVLVMMGLLAAHVRGVRAAGMLLGLAALPAVWLCAVGIFYYAKMALAHEHPALVDTWHGIRRLFWPAIALFVVDSAASAVLVGDVVFFGLAFRARGGVALAAFGVVCAYIGLMWLIMSLYHLPLLVAQLEMESGLRVGVILRKSFLLAADNPGFTVGLFVVIIAFAVICALPAMLGMALVFPGLAAFLLTSSLRELFVKYGVIEEEPETVEDKPWKLEN